jgi:hypothetical protein
MAACVPECKKRFANSGYDPENFVKGSPMKRFIQGERRGQSTLLPESLDDNVSDTNPVRVVDVFVDELDLINLGFHRAMPADAGRPAYRLKFC